jgi:hypothetical protein
MKKTILLFSLFFLTSCGSSVSQENKNTALSELPSFVDLNSNSVYPPILDQNSNSVTLGEVANTNGNDTVQGNMNAGDILNVNANSPSEPVDITLLTPQESAFDCQPLGIYEKMEFYPQFVKQFEMLYRYSATDIKNMIATSPSESGKQEIATKSSLRETRDNITSSCLSKNQTLFIVISEGDKGGYGFKIVRYQLGRGFIEVAQREDAQYGATWSYTPVSLGRRSGKILTMNVTGKSDNLIESLSYAYDYVNNYIRLVEYCSTKSGGKKICGNYPYVP